MIGVGLEEFGVEEFVAGKFFDGELFLDTQKKSYEAMGFKRFGYLASIPELLKVMSVRLLKSVNHPPQSLPLIFLCRALFLRK